MEVKIRSIGNSLGLIFPKVITDMMRFHVEDAVEIGVDEENRRLVVERKTQSLKENLLEGILASQDENLEFANDFEELEGEI